MEGERWHVQILFDGDAPPQEVEEKLKEYRQKYPLDIVEPQFGKLCDFIYTDFMYPNSLELKAICSRCRHVFYGGKGIPNDLSTYNYCPNCGAKIGTRKNFDEGGKNNE